MEPARAALPWNPSSHLKEPLVGSLPFYHFGTEQGGGSYKKSPWPALNVILDLLLELRTSSVGREDREDLGAGQGRPPDNDHTVDFWNLGDFEKIKCLDFWWLLANFGDHIVGYLVTLSHLWRSYGWIFSDFESSLKVFSDQKSPPKVQLVLEAKLAAWQVE